jgi:hypothetical protein
MSYTVAWCCGREPVTIAAPAHLPPATGEQKGEFSMIQHMEKATILAVVVTLAGCGEPRGAIGSAQQALGITPRVICDPMDCLPGGPMFNTQSLPMSSDGQVHCGCPDQPTFYDLPFHELDSQGIQDNDMGLRISWFLSRNGWPLRPTVDRDQLMGDNGAGTILRGTELVNARMQLRYRGGATYSLYITEVSTTPFYVGGGEVPTYRFAYRRDNDFSDPMHPLCDGDRFAIVFTGDRYDAVTKRVTVGPTPWFNIACLDSANARMHLWRYTSAGADATHSTSANERQALYRSLYADYCGTGQSFNQVVFNHVLGSLFTDRKGFMPRLGAVGSYEAVWNENGAVCVDFPRLGEAGDEQIWDEIYAVCQPPPCSPPPKLGWKNYLARWTFYGSVLTANRP